MKLTILGSGTYQPELERRSAAYLIQTAGQNICLDFGRGAIEQLMKVGLHINQIDAIFISHWHPDHISDLLPLIHITIAGPSDHGLWPIRKKPLKLFGPIETKERLDYLRKSSFLDYFDLKGKIEIEELSEGNIELGNIKISFYPTVHNPETRCLCYRLESEGKIFAYSGDTVESDGLARAIKDADLAVIEAAWPDEVHPKTHFTGSRAGKFAQKNGVKKLVITHMAPLYMQKFDPKADAKKEFKGEVVVAKDLLEIEI